MLTNAHEIDYLLYYYLCGNIIDSFDEMLWFFYQDIFLNKFYGLIYDSKSEYELILIKDIFMVQRNIPKLLKYYKNW